VQAREDVLAVVSHDIRNFLQAIKSGVQMLNKPPEKLGAVAVHEPLAEQKGIRLTAQSEVPAGTVVLCDRERILQVFSNLLGNAIKFCRHGDQIQVSLRAADGQMQAAVIDTGPGIASSDLPLVFDAYFSGAKNRHTGTGLGLYITKRIIEAHDGRIWIESEPGKGTSVHFTLALSKPEAGATS
jgi:signal transduction histidine kinase